MSRRSEQKYPALQPKYNLKIRTDLIDYDYLGELSPKHKLWLNKFTEEYVNATLNRNNLRSNLHRNKKLKKDCDDRNNSRNRCIYSLEKAKDKLKYLEELPENAVMIDSHENMVIEVVDEERN